MALAGRSRWLDRIDAALDEQGQNRAGVGIAQKFFERSGHHVANAIDLGECLDKALIGSGRVDEGE